MMDYGHYRRPASALVAFRKNPAGYASASSGQPCSMGQLSGPTLPHISQLHKDAPGHQLSASWTAPRNPLPPLTASVSHVHDAQVTYDNTPLHFRSPSYDSPCRWGLYTGPESVAMATPRQHKRYGSLASSDAHLRSTQSIQQATPRRGSESSAISSVASTCTSTAEATSAYSSPTTPGSLSPSSHGDSLLQSPSEGDSGMDVVPEEPPSPSRGCQLHAAVRPQRGRACSHSAPKRYRNTPIESTVLEEGEHQQADRLRSAPEANATADASCALGHGADQSGSKVSSLHARRQQHQLKMMGKAPAKQPIRLRLSPLPPAPLSSQGAQTPTLSPRALKPSRSMPHICDASGPPPTAPLPPLPTVPKLSPFALPMLASSPTLSTPNAALSTPPPCPDVRPPPPPSSPPARYQPAPELPLSSSTKSSTASATLANTANKAHNPVDRDLSKQQEQPEPEQPTSWDAQLRRHKMLLAQFPSERQNANEPPKQPRKHRSLGNLRTRSRSLPRPEASSHSQPDPTEPQLAHHASSFNLRGSKTPRPSTAKLPRDGGNRLFGALPPLPQPETPSISVFEEDSEDEDDTVRKFVRNLFFRRNRNTEVQTSKDYIGSSRDVPIGKTHGIPAKAVDMNGHNDRKKNHSSSSSFSVATTVGVSSVFSAASAHTEACNEGYEADCHLDRGASKDSSPRMSSEQGFHQKGPLLTRMFVRRSH